MKLQNVENNSVSTKGLYFTKATPIFNNVVAEARQEAYTTTKKGVKYIKDNRISETLKKTIKEIPIIKHMSKKNDVFVYLNEYQSRTNPKRQGTLLRIWEYDHFEKDVKQETFVASAYLKSRATELVIEQIKKKIIAK